MSGQWDKSLGRRAWRYSQANQGEVPGSQEEEEIGPDLSQNGGHRVEMRWRRKHSGHCQSMGQREHGTSFKQPWGAQQAPQGALT